MNGKITHGSFFYAHPNEQSLSLTVQAPTLPRAAGAPPTVKADHHKLQQALARAKLDILSLTTENSKMRDGYNKMEDGYNKLKEVHSSALEDNERLRKELQDVRSGMQLQNVEDSTGGVETPQAEDTDDDQVCQKANI